MSSVSSSTLQSSSSASSTSSSTPQSPSSPTGNQGNLYLFTFLSTLLVLLIISCSIVFRSYVLRRRYQRRFAEAFAAGAILAPRTQGGRKKRFRIRPKFYDTWLSSAESSLTWAELMPISVIPIKTKKKAKNTQTPDRTPDSHPETVFRRLISSHFINRNQTNRPSSLIDDGSPPSSPISPVPVTPVQEKLDPLTTSVAQRNAIQLAVLVAMPSPPRIASADEEDIPEIAFGVTRLHYKVNATDP